MTKIDNRAEKIVEYNRKAKALKSRFRGKIGKDALSLLEDVCFYNKSTYVNQDPHGTSINEGLRQSVLFIHNILNKTDEELDSRMERKLKQVK